MTTAVQFDWRRIEGKGLILASLGWSLLAQIPVVFWGIILLNLDLNEYFIGVIGTIIGVVIILATLSCTLAEDWDPFQIPTLKKVVSFSSIYILLYLVTFFGFFIIIEDLIPLGFIGGGLNPEQRYFGAIFLALTIIAIVTFSYYKLKQFLR
ncbi:MAG: hypothetical protein EAX86_11440 [Candidatus Heimdallarchaeota archaeon]|nr:hypothetical protein [Candidatus Heimdallarchaeota archaeon]